MRYSGMLFSAVASVRAWTPRTKAVHKLRVALLDFAAASDEEDGAQAVVDAAQRCLRGRQATVVVREGTGRMLADEAFDALSESSLVACESPHVINPD